MCTFPKRVCHSCSKLANKNPNVTVPHDLACRIVVLKADIGLQTVSEPITYFVNQSGWFLVELVHCHKEVPKSQA